MIDTDIIVATVTPSSPFDRLPLDFGDPGPTDLDRLAAILDYLTLCCGKLAPDEPGQHLAAEAMAEHKRLLAGATAATREQLSRCGAGAAKTKPTSSASRLLRRRAGGSACYSPHLSLCRVSVAPAGGSNWSAVAARSPQLSRWKRVMPRVV